MRAGAAGDRPEALVRSRCASWAQRHFASEVVAINALKRPGGYVPWRCRTAQFGRRTAVAKENRAHVTDRSTGSTVIEWNRPDVVQGHVAEKRVAAQVDRSELSRIGAHAGPSGATEPSSVGICDLPSRSRGVPCESLDAPDNLPKKSRRQVALRQLQDEVPR